MLRVDERGKKHGWPSWDPATFEGAVQRQFDNLPGANSVVVHMGDSAVFGLDIDTKNGVNGYEAAAEAGIELPVSPMEVRTPSGGVHRYFKAPEGLPIKNSAGAICPGVDIRHGRGLLIMDGSQIEGQFAGYRFAPGSGLVAVADLPELPRQFIDILLATGIKAKVTEPKPTKIVPLDGVEKVKCEELLEAELGAITGLPAGGRHDAALPHSSKIARCAKWLGMGYEESLGLFLDAYRESGGEHDEDMTIMFSGDWSKVEDFGKPVHANTVTVTPGIEAIAEGAGEDPEVLAEAQNIRRSRRAKELADEMDVPDFWSGDFHVPIQKQVNDPAVSDWIGNVIRKGETNVLYGASGAGKSFLAVDMAMSMVYGVPWVGGTHVNKGRVLYIACEDAAGVAGRAWDWCVAHGFDPEAPNDDFFIWAKTPDLHTESVPRQIAERAAAGGFDLIVLDTLGRATTDVDVTKAGKVTQMVERMDLMRSGREGCSVLAVAHTTTDKSKLAGGMALEGAVFSTTEVQIDESDVTTLYARKWKNGKKFKWDDYSFEIENEVMVCANAPTQKQVGTVPQPVPQLDADDNPFRRALEEMGE